MLYEEEIMNLGYKIKKTLNKDTQQFNMTVYDKNDKFQATSENIYDCAKDCLEQIKERSI